MNCRETFKGLLEGTTLEVQVHKIVLIHVIFLRGAVWGIFCPFAYRYFFRFLYFLRLIQLLHINFADVLDNTSLITSLKKPLYCICNILGLILSTLSRLIFWRLIFPWVNFWEFCSSVGNLWKFVSVKFVPFFYPRK